MHLVELADLAAEQLGRGDFVYLSRLGIEGAFVAAPHYPLIRSLREASVEPYIVRFVAIWLEGCTFRVLLRSPVGFFYSQHRPVTR